MIKERLSRVPASDILRKVGNIAVSLPFMVLPRLGESGVGDLWIQLNPEKYQKELEAQRLALKRLAEAKTINGSMIVPKTTGEKLDDYNRRLDRELSLED